MSTEHLSRLQAFVEELTQVVGTLTNATPTLEAAGFPGDRQWYATLSAADDASEVLAVAIDHERAALFARLASGAAGGVEEATVSDLLRNALSQAATALSVRPDGERVELELETLEPRTGVTSAENGFTAYAIAAPGLTEPLVLALAWVEATTTRLAREDGSVGSRINVILDIDLPVVVRFGHTELPIRALSRLGPGSVIDLGRSPDDPVEVLVSNRVVARGEVVIVGGNYGVRILDVASQSERARSMEA
jgi:flagellar motor switch protein FliN/FliY